MIIRLSKFRRALARIDEFVAVCTPWIEPRLNGRRRASGPLRKADERFLRRFIDRCRERDEGGIRVCFVLVKNLDDIA